MLVKSQLYVTTLDQTPVGVFKKTIPKIIGILGEDLIFTTVTVSLRAEDLITDQELKHIKAKPSPVEKGDELTQKLLDKIRGNDNPVQCLLKICDVFEESGNDTLKREGESMRSKVSSKPQLLIILSCLYLVLKIPFCLHTQFMFNSLLQTCCILSNLLFI